MAFSFFIMYHFDGTTLLKCEDFTIRFSQTNQFAQVVFSRAATISKLVQACVGARDTQIDSDSFKQSIPGA